MQVSVLIARIISYLFHPLFLPLLGLFMVFNLEEAGLWLPSSSMQLFLYLLTLTATCLLPLFIAFLLLKTKYIASLEMATKEERKIPYLAAATFYFMESYLLMKLDVPALVQAMILGATILVVSVLIINLFWKISSHMAGIGGLCGMMIAVSSRLQINMHFLLIALFLVAGFVAFSRLKLSAHNPGQVYVGFLLGVTVQLVLFL